MTKFCIDCAHMYVSKGEHPPYDDYCCKNPEIIDMKVSPIDGKPATYAVSCAMQRSVGGKCQNEGLHFTKKFRWYRFIKRLLS